MDLQVIAFQADITRVSTLMFARELSGAVFPETSIRDPFHNLSHHSNDRGNMDRFAQLNTYHMQKFAYVLEKLKALPDGDGTLLDHSLVLYGSSLSDGNQHNFSPLPIVLAGGASGRVQGRAAPAIPEGHPHVQPAADDAADAWRAGRQVWGQHGGAQHLVARGWPRRCVATRDGRSRPSWISNQIERILPATLRLPEPTGNARQLSSSAISGISALPFLSPYLNSKM